MANPEQIDVDDDDDFGDFGDAPATTSPTAVEEDDFGDFGEADANVSSSAVPAADDDFGDFGDAQPSQPVQQATKPLPTAASPALFEQSEHVFKSAVKELLSKAFEAGAPGAHDSFGYIDSYTVEELE